MKKLELEKIREIAEKRGYDILNDTYSGKDFYLIFKCKKCGESFSSTWDNFRVVKEPCRRCSSKKKWDIKSCSEYSFNRGYELLENEYVNNGTYLKFKHTECGFVFFMIWRNFCNLNQDCPKCMGQVKPTIEFCKAESNERGYLCLSDFYKNCKTKMKFKHVECGFEFEMTWTKFHISKNGCRKCSNLRTAERNKKFAFDKGNSLVSKFPYLISEWSTKNKKSPIEYTYGCNDKVWWICQEHGDFLSPISNRARRGDGCPKCSSSNSENRIGRFLEYVGMVDGSDFYREYRFQDCKYKLILPFDFYIPKHNLLIEYQGEQHFRPVCFGGMTIEKARVALKLQKKKDKIKKAYAKAKNISFLSIGYKNKNEIENIIKAFVESVG